MIFILTPNLISKKPILRIYLIIKLCRLLPEVQISFFLYFIANISFHGDNFQTNLIFIHHTIFLNSCWFENNDPNNISAKRFLKHFRIRNYDIKAVFTQFWYYLHIYLRKSNSVKLFQLEWKKNTTHTFWFFSFQFFSFILT